MRHSGAGAAWGVGAALLLSAGSAQSHALFGFQGPGFSGALHLLTAPLALAALVAGIALLHGQPARRTAGVAALLALAAIGGSVLGANVAVAGWLAALGVAVAGVAAAAGLGRASGWRALPFALIAGASIGLATEFDAFSVAAALGMGLAVGFLAGGALTLLGAFSRTPTARQRVALGLRVLGSWAAAIGLLLGALAWRVAQHGAG